MKCEDATPSPTTEYVETTSSTESVKSTVSTTESSDIIIDNDNDEEFVTLTEHEEYTSFLEPVIYSMMGGCVLMVIIVVLIICVRNHFEDEGKNREIAFAAKSKMGEEESPETSSKTNESLSADGNSETMGSQSDNIDV